MSPRGAQDSALRLIEQGRAILAIRPARAAKGQLCPAAKVAYTVSYTVIFSAAVTVPVSATATASAAVISLSTAADENYTGRHEP